MFNSKKYWEDRYKKNGNSGNGSYNKLAEFKAQIINNFIQNNNIHTIIDYGVGDGNQLRLFHIQNQHYIGIDVSPTIIKKCKQIFQNDPYKKFILDSDMITLPKADLVLSCDVIYHLIEDQVYNNYMKNLFTMSNKYVIIYAKDQDIRHTVHVRFRKFTNYIEKNQRHWKLIQYIPNKYPQKVLGKNNETTSPSDFYIFENFQHKYQIYQEWSDYIEKNLLPLIKVKLEGNIYSKHHSIEKALVLVPKVYNIISLLEERKPTSILEIGFNAGFSSLLMKMTGLSFDLTCIDINYHEYVVPCFNKISSDYNKINILLKPSQIALQDLIKEQKTYDIIHIDGDHSLQGARSDLDLCLQLAHENTILIFDDTNIPHLYDLCQNYVKERKLKPYNMKNFIVCTQYKHDFFIVNK